MANFTLAKDVHGNRIAVNVSSIRLVREDGQGDDRFCHVIFDDGHAIGIEGGIEDVLAKLGLP